MSQSAKEPMVCLGVIADAHGINGEVLIKSYTEYWEDIGSYGPLFDEGGGQQIELKDLRVVKKGVIAKVRGLRYRDQAEALKGRELYIHRSRLPEQEEEETWYHIDLIGLKTVNADGTEFGEVLSLPNYGAGDLVEIRLNAGGKTILVAFTKENVPDINVSAGKMTVIPPEEDALEDEI